MLGFSQWKISSKGTSQIVEGRKKIEAAGIYELDHPSFLQKLSNAPERFSKLPGNIISIPNAQGKLEKFEVWEASNFSPSLQAKFPQIRAYVGVGIDDPTAYLRFSVSPTEISTMTLRAGKSEFIEQYSTDGKKYIVFDSKKHRSLEENAFSCQTQSFSIEDVDIQPLINAHKSSAGVFKTFRLALAVDGEYSQHFGGTVENSLVQVNNTLTRVNGVFEKDFSVNLQMIDNVDLIFIDPANDPFGSNSIYPDLRGLEHNPQLHRHLKETVGFENFDIGHVFSKGGNNGSAGCIGCVCMNVDNTYLNYYGAEVGKGAGFTANADPKGDKYDIDYVAHEMGHQLGANHTFSYGDEINGVNVEPGSGSTIMGYAGITGYNVQLNSDDYFAYRSVLQVQNNLQNKPCAVNTTLTNATPIVNAGQDYDIPKGTAFKLTGTASDPNGDAMTFTWEQNDPANIQVTGPNSRVSFTKATGPNFRSLTPTTSMVRYFPKFEYVLNNDVTENETYWRSKWEAVTSVARMFNFTFTARDNNPEAPQTATDAVRITVRNVGPFKVTSPTSNQNVDLSAGTMLVQWDVAGTDAAPINTTNVRILFSSDNGESFTVVAESTPNDGSETITFPAGTVAGANGRIMIEAIDNIYYAVSRKFNLTGTLGVAELTQNAFGLYPNPNNGQFTLSANNIEKGEVKSSIFDTSGKLVHSQTNSHNGGNLNINYKVKLPTGVYMVVIETAKEKSTSKLIIK